MLNEIHLWSAAIRRTEMWNKQEKKELGGSQQKCSEIRKGEFLNVRNRL